MAGGALMSLRRAHDAKPLGKFATVARAGAGRRVLSTYLIALVVGLMVSGCSRGDAFEPLEARDFLERSRGVENATVTTGKLRGTLKSTYFVDVRVRVDSTEGDDRLGAIALRAVQTGWATRIDHAPYGVYLEVSGKPDIDVGELLDGAGLHVQSGIRPSAPVLVSAESLQRRWGKWPGARPDD
ncbi:hypothetical protein DEI99_006290 [Curtobacterium sp. MCLR17_036]|uniref:hypothetical protein n=1 Tax=Curtobacterium sp. MCLR17_036 TaxID=2175620 RepID=UPI000DB357E6|nr:hypothetical protein [Curtobacterium sp. MCLR17_036]WIE66140.1 hypothetical protein DEI99_006290 [Curtobacterium sp. MCLR17_036]